MSVQRVATSASTSRGRPKAKRGGAGRLSGKGGGGNEYVSKASFYIAPYYVNGNTGIARNHLRYALRTFNGAQILLLDNQPKQAIDKTGNRVTVCEGFVRTQDNNPVVQIRFALLVHVLQLREGKANLILDLDQRGQGVRNVGERVTFGTTPEDGRYG